MKLGQSKALIPIKGLLNLAPLQNCGRAIEIPLELSVLGFPKWDSQISSSLLELVVSQKITAKRPCNGVSVK